ncbi:MAG: SpoIIE family protein phosphatase, partial [Pseudonocardiaceae bacterium]
TYLVFDPATRWLRFANAGHPPPLVVCNGKSVYLGDGLSPPVGVTADDQFAEASEKLSAGATLLLYTDGLIERRGMSIREGLDRLSREAGANATSDLEQLCDLLLSSLVEQNQIADDIALVAMRPLSLLEEPLSLNVPAEPQMLGQIRGTLRRWLHEVGVDATAENEIVVACGEACANVVQHAYKAAPGVIDVTAHLVGGSVEVSVRDHGEWRPGAKRDGGWGFSLMQGLMDSVEVERGSEGTEVLMLRRVQVGGPM